MNKLFTLLVLTILSTMSYAASVDTLNIPSLRMNKAVQTVIIKPEGYRSDKTYPVLYLLHGYSGRYSDWVNKAPVIKNLVDAYQFIIVCPDGGYGSWYWDSPIDKAYAYETFVADELIQYIDQHYATVADRKGRAITGLSMGGHGALSLAFKHQDLYGAAGSTAGGVDFRPFPLNWEIANRIGSYADHPELWDKMVVHNMTHLLVPKALEIFIDCGYDDFFYDVNIELHQKLLARQIKHTFLVMEGAHNWDYWKKSIVYQLSFFNKYFNSNAIQK